MSTDPIEPTHETPSADVDESGAGAQLAESEQESEQDTDAETSADDYADDSRGRRRRVKPSVLLAFGVIPFLIIALALGSGVLRWMVGSSEINIRSGSEASRVAATSTATLLSYRPDTAEAQLEAARSLLTGDFQTEYQSLTKDVVIPGAKQKQISATATVPAASVVSATAHHAIILVFVDQTVTIGQDAPTDTASSVRVTLEKISDHWLISHFDPV